MRTQASGVRFILIATVASFLLEGIAGEDAITTYALWPLHTDFGPWQLVTYAFLHANIAHLGGMLGAYWVIRHWLRQARRN